MSLQMIAQHPQLYKCSIAAGSVVEWELYDSVNFANVSNKNPTHFRHTPNVTWANQQKMSKATKTLPSSRGLLRCRTSRLRMDD